MAESAPYSTMTGDDFAGNGKDTSARKLFSTATTSASPTHRAPAGGSNNNGAGTNGGPFAPRTNTQQASKSLLGQDYKPPTKEKFAKRGAVKIVPAEDKAHKVKLGEEAARQAESHDRKHKEAKETKQEAFPSVEDAKEPEGETRRCRDAEIKMADKDALQSEKGIQKLASQSGQAYGTSGNVVVTANPGNGGSQSSKKHAAETLSLENNASSAERSDFLTNSGRRICISNLPAGASDKDIHQLIEQKTNTGQSIETITVFRRPNGQPGYALVDVSTPKDASHIVKWMTDERLFGWPIDMRMAHNLSQDVVDKLLETGSATLVLAHEKHSMKEIGKTATCRYWNLGHCRNGVNCKYLHGIDVEGSSPDTMQPRGHTNGRRNGAQHGRRNYNFDNIPLPAEDGEEEASGSILGASVYRSTALRVITDDF
ncbi:hypothetical protein SLS58_009910 [Diplodia intermedia]|uniref:C3H1-type domain-containing protein n=1 Tax=Diplodia intermedia TaxID=856260 RepID=A0ABR3T9U8_9PEZI